ncbi:MAG TPA: phosphatidate cytidylyltransferase [Vicinamibacterales bacterium]|jgi:phosphatidate cytidylyltransferase|nr:phosphatidate cytidylyltransferase [Vicinamibacterales bacterium]
MTRLFSGAVLLGGVVLALWFLPPLYLVGIAVVVALLAFREYAGIAARTGATVSKPAAGMATALSCIAVGVPGLPVEVAMVGTTLGLSAVVLAAAAAGRQSGEALQNAAVSAFAPLYLGLPLGMLAATRWTLGREAVLLLILTVVISDSVQYYSGRLFGRHLLAPVVSPKKTVEGALGGFIGGALAVGVIGHWWLPFVALPWRLGLGLAIVAVGIVGDLFESLLKRSAGVKDASALIPGHGGVLDRIDALLFAAPVFYVFVRYRF